MFFSISFTSRTSCAVNFPVASPVSAILALSCSALFLCVCIFCDILPCSSCKRDSFSVCLSIALDVYVYPSICDCRALTLFMLSFSFFWVLIAFLKVLSKSPPRDALSLKRSSNVFCDPAKVLPPPYFQLFSRFLSSSSSFSTSFAVWIQR